MATRFIVLGLCVLLLSSCSPQRYFYYPNQTLYTDPEKVGLHPDIMQYPSLNGKKLTALFFKTEHKPKGTIVHFHGNYGNISNHYPLALFLLKYGYDVLSFDYQGYGGSEGKPTAKNLVEDGIASIRFAQANLRDPSTGVAVFGQSVGGATAIVSTSLEPLAKAAVIEAAFESHAKMARAVLGRHVLTWLVYPIAPLFVNRSQDPIRHVANVSPRPLFFIHGDKDGIVPVYMSEDLFKKAQEPKKLWIVPGAKHLEVRLKEGARYERAISAFFDEALAKDRQDGTASKE